MNDFWIFLDKLFYTITGIKNGVPDDDYINYLNLLAENAMKEFQNVFSVYSDFLDELNEQNFTNFFKKLVQDSLFEQKLIIVGFVWFFSFYIAFYKTQTIKHNSLSILFTFFIYLGIAGTYKEKLLKNFEPIYSFSYFQQIPFLVSFARLVNFPIALISFSICITLGYIYKFFRILFYVLIILRIKKLLFSDSIAYEGYVILFFTNCLLLFLLSKLIKVIEITIASLIFSSFGCFSIISHLMIFPCLKDNIKKFISSILLESNNNVLKNPVFLTWLVLFAYSARVTFIPVCNYKKA